MSGPTHASPVRGHRRCASPARSERTSVGWTVRNGSIGVAVCAAHAPRPAALPHSRPVAQTHRCTLHTRRDHSQPDTRAAARHAHAARRARLSGAAVRARLSRRELHHQCAVFSHAALLASAGRPKHRAKKRTSSSRLALHGRALARTRSHAHALSALCSRQKFLGYDADLWRKIEEGLDARLPGLFAFNYRSANVWNVAIGTGLRIGRSCSRRSAAKHPILVVDNEL